MVWLMRKNCKHWKDFFAICTTLDRKEHGSISRPVTVRGGSVIGMRITASLERYVRRVVLSIGGRGMVQPKTDVSWKQRGLECTKELSGDTSDTRQA